MRRLPLLIAVAAVAVLASPATGQAGIFHVCTKSSLGECAYVNVPLDRSGAVPGSIPLYAERAKGEKKSGGALFALAGGPGQAGGSVSRDFSRALGPASKTHDLIVFDQRGTGRSGDLDCISLERASSYHADKAVAKCANRLGARRSHYTTRDSADDMEAIRQQIGVDKISIYGVSYGTKVALTYAQRYPEHVERLILDSVVEQGGPDPLYRPNFQALPRILAQLCAGRCLGITPDPTADLAAIVRKMAAAPVRGPVITDSGRRVDETLSRTELYQLVLQGDFDPTIRAELPAAVRSALDGDTGPLLRLKRRVSTHPSFKNRGPSAFSNALFTATICEETALPWDRSSPPDQHLLQARGIVAGLPESSFFPFDRTTGTNTDLVALCKDWPQSVPAPDVAGALPDVPVLILSGLDDFRTPLEGAERTAALFPRATLLKVPNSGHSVLGSDFSGCADRALRRFFDDSAAPTNCPNRPIVRPAGIAPTSLSKVRPLGAGGLRGRTLGAIESTLDDTRSQLAEIAGGQIFFDQDVVDGGLRGGSFAFNGARLRLKGLSFVPGVALNGKLHDFDLSSERGRIKVSGSEAARGVVELHRGLITGTLGGRHVSARIKRLSVIVSAASAGARAGRVKLPRPLAVPPPITIRP